MASIFTHAAVGILIGRSWSIAPRRWSFWAVSAALAMLPDADVIGFRFGVHYEDLFGHRGFTHSLLFAALAGAITVLIGWRDHWRLGFHFSAVTASHGFLDAMTNGGLGVGFFIPFDAGRYFFPWRPIVVSPIGPGAFFSEWGLRVLVSEVDYAILPALLLSLLLRVSLRRLSTPV